MLFLYPYRHPLNSVVPNSKKLLMFERHADSTTNLYQWRKSKHEDAGRVRSTDLRKLCNLLREETFDTYVLS